MGIFDEENARRIRKITTELGVQKGEFLDTHIGGLLAAGVPQSDIEIVERPHAHATTIMVRGKCFAQCYFDYSVEGRIRFITCEPKA